MKVIFLDIDGVLNSDRSVIALPMQTIFENDYRFNYLVSKVDPVAIALLNKITKETGAVLVGSTSNRIHLGFDGLDHALKEMGVESILYDITPSLSTNRGGEIQEWLNNHNTLAEGESIIESFIIIDDSDDMLSSQQENFVRVNPAVGLAVNDMRKAIKILNGEAPTSLILI